MESPDDRAPIARAYARVSYIMSIALEMVVPGLLGFWIDHHLGTKLLFAVLGFAFGLTFGVWQLVRLGRADFTPRGSPSLPDATADNEAERDSERD